MTDAAALVALCAAKKLRIVTAESCTGGLIAVAITDIPGASDIFDRGFVTYSNDAKIESLEVKESLLAAHGAVSEQVVLAMAEGALYRSQANLAVAVSGIAGPGGGTAEKPVGLVFIAVANTSGKAICEKCQFSGSRAEIRQAAVKKALQMLYELAKTH